MATEKYDFAVEFKAVFLPKQKPAPDPVPESEMAVLSTYPPLAQVTQLSEGEVAFVAILDVPEVRSGEGWEVAVWHSDPSNNKDQAWTEYGLSPSPPDQVLSSLQDRSNGTSRLHFSGKLSVRELLHFTVKFRSGPDQAWRWVRDEAGTGDGTVIINGGLDQKDTQSGLPDLIHGLNPDLKWQSVMSQSPRTRLWSVEAPVAAAQGDQSTIIDIPLGTPWGSFLRWFAVVRIWAPWLAPRHGQSKFELDKDALMVSFLSPQGRHMVLLAISGLRDVMTLFRHGSSGDVLLHVRNDGGSDDVATVLVATGDNFESANAAVMYHARDLIAFNKTSTKEVQAEMSALENDIKPEWYENWYDGLGYCTWNGVGQQLTEEKVLNAVDTLAEHNINVTSLIIDDNWQDIDYKGDGQFQYAWNDFEAEPKAFPRGLKATISDIRSKHKNIQHIAVWHAILGYWAGISPEGKIAQTYKTIEVVREDALRRNLPLGGKMTAVAKEDVDRFYDDFYKFLSSCGIDGVKTDAQFIMDTWVSAKTRRELIDTYLDSWTLSSLRHFSIKTISCMSQVPQIMFYSLLPRDRPRVLFRNSDDFFPEIPASHPWHLWTNAHNSLFTQHLNVLPDWDMFQTVHDYSGFHAAGRCVSGGPIYVTDVPGQHNLDLINQMTGQTTHGKTAIFRPSVIGKSIDQYVGYDDDALLKVGAYHGTAEVGSSIIGFFNISARPLTDIVPLSRFPGVLDSKAYVVRSHNTGRTTEPLRTSSPKSQLAVSLDVRGYDIFCAYPLSVFKNKKDEAVYLANLGLVGKMTGCAAVLNNNLELQSNGRILLDTNLKALGVLGVYISTLPDLTLEQNFMATIQGQPIPPHTVTKGSDFVLNIDVETAWKEMGLNSGWSNELQVKLFVTL